MLLPSDRRDVVHRSIRVNRNVRFACLKKVIDMKKIVVFVAFVIFPTVTFAADVNTLRGIQEIVTALCRGVSLDGKKSDLSIDAKAEVGTIILKKIIGGSVEGDIKFTQKEWDGIQEKMKLDYVQCVSKNLPVFLKILN